MNTNWAAFILNQYRHQALSHLHPRDPRSKLYTNFN
jgi:hypothetical protein